MGGGTGTIQREVQKYEKSKSIHINVCTDICFIKVYELYSCLYWIGLFVDLGCREEIL
jgi:hypothetical protein